MKIWKRRKFQRVVRDMDKLRGILDKVSCQRYLKKWQEILNRTRRNQFYKAILLLHARKLTSRG